MRAGIHPDRSLVLAALVALVPVGCGDGGDRACADVACLHQALSEAVPGDTVRVDAGTYEGNFTLPAGVALAGAGADATTLKFMGEAPVVEMLAGGGHTTEISDLALEGGAGGGVSCSDPCEVAGSGIAVNRVRLELTGGVGLQVSDVCSVRMETLIFGGNIDETSKDGIPIDPDQARYAAVGVALVDVQEADLREVHASGFAAFGVVLLGTPASWDGGEVHHGVGTGIQIDGPVTVTLANLTIHDVWMGATPFGYGIWASNGAHLITDTVIAENNDNAGLLLDNASGEHTNSRFD